METDKENLSKQSVGRPRKKENWTPELLVERANEYFKKCDERQEYEYDKEGCPYPVLRPMPYTLEGLCVYLKVAKSTFWKWRKSDPIMQEAAEFIHTKITENRIVGALDGKQNPGFAKYLLNNTNPDEYRDRIEVEGTVSEEVRSIFEHVKAHGAGLVNDESK